jgi:hypothetical protein
MKRSQMRITFVSVAAGIAICGGLWGAVPVSAHNAGNIVFPDGNCLDVGSGNSGPFVAESNPHYHEGSDVDQDRLDLIDGPGDQYGARFAATRGNSRVLPGACP